ncbi:MAG: hypothetical protein ACK4S0_01135 [Sediminibacterium sp.]
MTLAEFKGRYYCKARVSDHGRQRTVNVDLYRRKLDTEPTDSMLGTSTCSMDRFEMDTHVQDSHAAISLNPVSWDDVIEKAKRFALDYFVMALLIEDFYPINSDTDISEIFED